MSTSQLALLTARLRKLRANALSWKCLLLLLLLPCVVILIRLTIWRVPVMVTNLLAVDAILIMLFWLGRLLLAYGESRLPEIPERQKCLVPTWPSLVAEQSVLLRAAAESGYCYDREAGAGVKRSAGATFAMLLVVCGLLAVIPVGVYDYLHNFSGIVYLGTGNPLPLDSEESYGIYARGPLASYAEIAMKMKGEEIILPNRHYPLGGKELKLLANDGSELWRGVLVPGTRQRQGNYDFYMEGFVYDLFVSIGQSDGHGLFGSRVRVTPLPAPVDGFSHYGTFEAPLDKVKGEVWFDMQTDRTKVRLNHGGRTILAVLGTAGDSLQKVDGYNFNLAGIGRWTHVNILRIRHIPLLKVGGVCILLGLLLRLLIREKRFKLEEGADGSGTLLTNDGKLLQLVKAMGEIR